MVARKEILELVVGGGVTRFIRVAAFCVLGIFRGNNESTGRSSGPGNGPPSLQAEGIYRCYHSGGLSGAGRDSAEKGPVSMAGSCCGRTDLGFDPGRGPGFALL